MGGWEDFVVVVVGCEVFSVGGVPNTSVDECEEATVGGCEDIFSRGPKKSSTGW